MCLVVGMDGLLSPAVPKLQFCHWRAADKVGYVTPPEFTDFQGLLTVTSVRRQGSFTAPSDTVAYLFKRDIHKVRLEKPHLPPGVCVCVAVLSLQRPMGAMRRAFLWCMQRAAAWVSEPFQRLRPSQRVSLRPWRSP